MTVTGVDWGVIGAIVVIVGGFIRYLIRLEKQNSEREKKHDELVREFLKVIENHLDHATEAFNENSAALNANNKILAEVAINVDKQSSLIELQQKCCKCINKNE